MIGVPSVGRHCYHLLASIPTGRIPDVLRGLALVGVIISNMRWFSGLVFRFPAYRQYLQEWSLDSVAFHAVGIFVTGKAIATLSFLFGLGFAVQLLRAEQRGVPFVSVYCRRLAVLLMLGLVHMILLWYGDILTLYAVLGFVLFWAARRSDRTVVTLAVLLIVGLPVALGVAATVMNLSDAPSEQALAAAGLATANADALAVFQGGTYAQIIRQNLVQARRFYEGAERSTKEQRDGRDIPGRLHERPDEEDIHQQREVGPRVRRPAADKDHDDRFDAGTADSDRQSPRGDTFQCGRMFGDTFEYAPATDEETEQKQTKVVKIRESLCAPQPV